MRGRKPVPTNLKVLHGNPGRRPLPKDEPQPPEGEVERPKWVTKRARVFWERHAPVLRAMRVLTPADVEALAALCEAEAEFWDAREDVRKRGIQIDVTRYDRKTGNAFYVTEDNPSVRIASDAFKRMKTLLTEFGMTPSSRTRISVAPKVEEEDPFARYERQA